jgi:hypothetical protein
MKSEIILVYAHHARKNFPSSESDGDEQQISGSFTPASDG